MKETSFIKQNKQKWYKFEQMYQQNRRDPDELSNLFIELTDDLSYARTHYPKRSVRVYLNGLAQKVYDRLYRKRRDSFRKVIRFWTTSIPLEMYRAKGTLLTSFIVMAIGCIIGWVSTMDDPYFMDVIMGEGRVAYEENCIAENKPISVYQTQDEASMFFELVTNNMRVAFTAFVLGILISIGSGFFMVYNGIMLGSFVSFYK
ncbi:MAG: stage II sporulation protein M [Flavobacteriales bacterium]|nr:stage II sporulation protein M [Flavobacteriales bacterium]